MQSSKPKSAPENEGGTDKRNTESIPESVAKHIGELYAEYIKPERFIQWLVEQEQLKRKLAKQQQQLELQHQQRLAHIDIYEHRRNIEC